MELDKKFLRVEKDKDLLYTHQELLTYLPDMYAAALRSKVTRKKMGSIIVGHLHGKVWHILSDGCNGVASGHEHVFENEGVTLPHVIHAEDNAMKKLDVWKSLGSDDSLSKFSSVVLFVMSSPCPACAKKIIESNSITDVVYMDGYRDQSGLDLLEKYNINCYQIAPNQHLNLAEMATQIPTNIVVSNIQSQLSTVFRDFSFLKGRQYFQLSAIGKSQVEIDLMSTLDLFHVNVNIEVTKAIRYALISVAGIVKAQGYYQEVIVNDKQPEYKPETIRYSETLIDGARLFKSDTVFKIKKDDVMYSVMLAIHWLSDWCTDSSLKYPKSGLSVFIVKD